MRTEEQLRKALLVASERVEVCEVALQQAQSQLQASRNYKEFTRLKLEKFQAQQETKNRAISDAVEAGE